MKPYGRNKKCKFHEKTDHHILENSFVNWWETFNNTESRKTMKQKVYNEFFNT